MPCPKCNAEDHPELLRKPYEVTIPQECWLYQNSAYHRRQWGGVALAPIVVPAEPAAAYPSTIQMAANAAKATAEWVAAGKPVRSEAEQKRIHLICEGCQYFDKQEDRCRVCGCGLSQESSVRWMKFLGIADAIGMETHHCPLPEPKW